MYYFCMWYSYWAQSPFGLERVGQMKLPAALTGLRYEPALINIKVTRPC